jgi:hypothetical protein
MKNVQITLAVVLAIATSNPALALPKCSWRPTMPNLSMPAMPELNSKNALIATATVAAVGGLYVAYNKGLIGKAATAIQDIVTTHPRKTAAVLVTATALIAANYFGYFDGAKDAAKSLFKKAEAKVVAPKVDGAAPVNVEAPVAPAPDANATGTLVDAGTKVGTSGAVIVGAPILNSGVSVDTEKILTAIDDLRKGSVESTEKVLSAIEQGLAKIGAKNSADTENIILTFKQDTSKLGMNNLENANTISAAFEKALSNLDGNNAKTAATNTERVLSAIEAAKSKLVSFFEKPMPVAAVSVNGPTDFPN